MNEFMSHVVLGLAVAFGIIIGFAVVAIFIGWFERLRGKPAEKKSMSEVLKEAFENIGKKITETAAKSQYNSERFATNQDLSISLQRDSIELQEDNNHQQTEQSKQLKRIADYIEKLVIANEEREKRSLEAAKNAVHLMSALHEIEKMSGVKTPEGQNNSTCYPGCCSSTSSSSESTTQRAEPDNSFPLK